VYAYLENKKGDAAVDDEEQVGGAGDAPDERTALLRD
jgi:hypothetical protein